MASSCHLRVRFEGTGVDPRSKTKVDNGKDKRMRAVIWRDVGDIRMDSVPEPSLIDPTDAIVKITRSGICGTEPRSGPATSPAEASAQFAERVAQVAPDARMKASTGPMPVG